MPATDQKIGEALSRYWVSLNNSVRGNSDWERERSQWLYSAVHTPLVPLLSISNELQAYLEDQSR